MAVLAQIDADAALQQAWTDVATFAPNWWPSSSSC